MPTLDTAPQAQPPGQPARATVPTLDAAPPAIGVGFGGLGFGLEFGFGVVNGLGKGLGFVVGLGFRVWVVGFGLRVVNGCQWLLPVFHDPVVRVVILSMVLGFGFRFRV